MTPSVLRTSGVLKILKGGNDLGGLKDSERWELIESVYKEGYSEITIYFNQIKNPLRMHIKKRAVYAVLLIIILFGLWVAWRANTRLGIRNTFPHG